MPTFRNLALCLILVTISSCRENTVDPYATHERIKSVSFEVQLPAQDPDSELVEMDIPFDLGVPVGVVTSVTVSCRGVTAPATHACGPCDSGEESREYTVPKFLEFVVASNSREFKFSISNMGEGQFEFSDEPLDCSFACDAVFTDGTGVLRVDYGSSWLYSSFFCGPPDGPLEYCIVNPGKVDFLGSLEFTITYHDYALPAADE